MRSTLTVLALVLLPLAASGEDRWLHVAVDGDEETVRINLPMAVAAAAVPLIESHVHDARLELNDAEFDRADLRRLLVALNEAKDGEYVTIDDHEDRVRISKEGKYLLVHAAEDHGRGEAGEHVQVRMPMEVVTALISGDEDDLDLSAALDALARHADGDIVTVRDGEETVRIWIDQKQAD